MIDKYFTCDGAPKRCPKCNSENFTRKVIEIVDLFQGQGPVCEAEYYCECGECVGFWVYGAWSPEYKEEFAERLKKEET